MVCGYIVFAPTSDISDTDGLIATGFPNTDDIQLPLICVAGSQGGEVGRVRLNSGSLRVWYSNVKAITGNTYLIPISANVS